MTDEERTAHAATFGHDRDLVQHALMVVIDRHWSSIQPGAICAAVIELTGHILTNQIEQQPNVRPILLGYVDALRLLVETHGMRPQ